MILHCASFLTLLEENGFFFFSETKTKPFKSYQALVGTLYTIIHNDNAVYIIELTCNDYDFSSALEIEGIN